MLGFDQKSSAGFMELLGLEDFNSNNCSIFDILASEQPLVAPLHNQTQMASFNHQKSSEVLNNPTTPNSSSLSSVSSGAEQSKVVIHQQQDEELHQQNTNPQLKPKKSSSTSSSQIKKKQKREPRFAFMTKSEVDHLEDGYRWRKYGQKAVKNSPFPRSYYRCTNSSCNVKKRVERSFNDASIVVTTYEGQHTHQSPAMPRAFPVGVSPVSGVSPFSSTAIHMNNLMLPYERQHYDNLALPSNCGHMMVHSHPNAPASMDGAEGFGFGSAEAMAFLRDNGLLQDIVPSIVTTENQ